MISRGPRPNLGKGRGPLTLADERSKVFEPRPQESPWNFTARVGRSANDGPIGLVPLGKFSLSKFLTRVGVMPPGKEGASILTL